MFIKQLLERVMQQRAQSNVPVIPNNGNPNGANNMPAAAKPAAMPAPPRDWRSPSSAFSMIQEMLKAPLLPPVNLGLGQRMPTQPVDGRMTTGPTLPSQSLVKPVLPAPAQQAHRFRDMRQAARAEGDFYMMPKRGQAFAGDTQQQEPLRPVVPIRRENI